MSSKNALSKESDRATAFLNGRIVKFVKRHRSNEVLVEFEDGTRLFVNAKSEPLELSITGCDKPNS